jgi:hypothetical protein
VRPAPRLQRNRRRRAADPCTSPRRPLAEAPDDGANIGQAGQARPQQRGGQEGRGEQDAGVAEGDPDEERHRNRGGAPGRARVCGTFGRRGAEGCRGSRERVRLGGACSRCRVTQMPD